MRDFDKWKEDIVRSLTDANRFFSNAGKFERECWVAKVFLHRIGVSIELKDLKPAEEPTDVSVNGANFQIKEALPPGRKRQLEYSVKLSEAEAASSREDLLESYSPVEMTGKEIFDICKEYAEKLVNEHAYGRKEMSGIDLLVYVNYPGNHEWEPYAGQLQESSFRSVSFLSNRYASVIFARESTAPWLRAQLGVVSDRRADEDSD